MRDDPNEKKLLTDGKTTKGERARLFSKRWRIAILLSGCLALMLFLVLPAVSPRFDGVNAVYVSAARAIAEPMSTVTPLPTSFLSEYAGDAPSVTPTPTPGVLLSQYALLQQNDDYPAVQKLQLRLMELGYLDADEPSTQYGEATAVAVSLFQRTLSSEMDGVATSELQENLFSSQAAPYEMKLGDEGADVRSMQSRLTELGYFEEKESGFFGVATEDAVKAFQKKNQLDADGVFQVDDRDLLYSPAARPKIDPTPTPTPKPTPKPTRRPTAQPTSTPGGGGGGGGEPSTTATPEPTDDSGGGGSFTPSYSADGIISVARAQEGKRYVWSEEGPNTFDCSGLVYYCLRTCGVSVSRYSASGFSQMDGWTAINSISDLSRGDLVFFRSDDENRVNHTGIYLGGDRFIHASSSKGKVVISSISGSYWVRNFVIGRRVFG